MLSVNPEHRPTADDLLKEPWFQKMKQTNLTLEQQTLPIQNLKQFKCKYDFQKAILLYFVSFFDLKEEKTRLYNVFKSIDKDGDGQLDRKELKEAYSKNESIFSSEEEIDEIFNKIDVNNTGHIDFSEFLLATLDYKKGIREKELRQIFNLIDKSGDGSLTEDEIADFFKLGSPQDILEIRELIKEIDTNGDGKVQFDEFVKMMSIFFKKKEGS